MLLYVLYVCDERIREHLNGDEAGAELGQVPQGDACSAEEAEQVAVHSLHPLETVHGGRLGHRQAPLPQLLLKSLAYTYANTAVMPTSPSSFATYMHSRLQGPHI